MSIGSRLLLLATVLGIAHQSVGESSHHKPGQASVLTSTSPTKDPPECEGTLRLFYAADRRVIIGKRILGWMKQCSSLPKQAGMRELATVMLRSQAEAMFDFANQLLQNCPNLLSQNNINSEEFKNLGGYGFEALRDFGIEKQRPVDGACERKHQNIETKLKMMKLLSDPEVKEALHDLQQCKKASLASSEEDQESLQSLRDEAAREVRDISLNCPDQAKKSQPSSQQP